LKIFGRDITLFASKPSAKMDGGLVAPDMEQRVRRVNDSEAQAYRYTTTNADVDTVLAAKGLRMYTRDMMADDQVKSCVKIKTLGVLVGGYSVQPAVGEDEDGYEEAQDIADFVDYCLREMTGSIEAVLSNIAWAMVPGFSVNEINWRIFEDGEYKGKIGLDSIRPKPSDSFTFDMDAYGDVHGLFQWVGQGQPVPVPLDKILLFSYDDQRTGLPQGVSDLRAAYQHYWSKQGLMKWRNVGAEKHGVPMVLGRYPVNMPKRQQDELLNALKSVQTDAAIIVPQGVEVEFMAVSQSSMFDFNGAIDNCNKGIARGIFGQVLATDEGSDGGGSYAQAKIHKGILGMHLDGLRREIAEEVLREQLIKRLVNYNFQTTLYPDIILAPPDDRDLESLARIMDVLLKGGVVDPREPFIREEFGFPPKPEELEQASPEMAAAGDAAEQSGDGQDGLLTDGEEEKPEAARKQEATAKGQK